mgnify:CR=1 FL=1
MHYLIIQRLKFRRIFDSRVKGLTKPLSVYNVIYFTAMTPNFDVGSMATERQQLSEIGVSKLHMVNMT